MGFFGIIFAIAVIAIIVSVTKEAKKAKNAEKARQERQEREARQSTASTTTTKPSQPSLLQPHTHSEQQRVTPVSSTLNVESKDEARERAQRELQARLNEYKARKADAEAQRNRQDGKIAPTIAPRVSATTTAHSHNEAHSDIVYKDHAKYRVEEVPVMNSIGGQSDEGCSEHYNLRYVKIDRPIIPEHLELTELQKCIVYGEIINQPAFKKNYRR